MKRLLIRLDWWSRLTALRLAALVCRIVGCDLEVRPLTTPQGPFWCTECRRCGWSRITEQKPIAWISFHMR